MSETAAGPDSASAIAPRLADGRLTSGTVWSMLFLRWGLALGAQCVFAVGYMVAGAADPWNAAAAWWLTSFALAEVFNLWLLARLARREGLRLRDLYAFGDRSTLKGDLTWLALAFVVTAVAAAVPNPVIATALWGGPQRASDLLFRAVPVWVAWVTIVGFPIVHALTELPTYFGYVMPRLEALTRRPWLAMALCALALSTQHVFLPLIFDWRYLVWRATMFLPLAFWMAFALKKRPTLMPYLVATHVLLDASLPVFVLLASIKAAG